MPTAIGQKVPMMPYTHWYKPDGEPDMFSFHDLWDKHSDADCSVLCGTGDLYCIDIDAKNDAIVAEKFYASIVQWIQGCYVERTMSGGVHIWFRHKTQLSPSNCAWVQKNGQWHPVVELRGYRNLCRIYPSFGITQDKGSIDSISYLPTSVLESILEVADKFNQRPPEQKIVYEKPERTHVLDRPGEDYSNNCDLNELLDLFVDAGWVIVKQGASRILLRRPMARTRNHDADISVIHRTFQCYSPSVSDFPTNKAMSFFACYATLRHGGDYGSAAKQLHAEGWGTTVTYTDTDVAPSGPQVEGEDPLWEQIKKTRITIANKPSEKSYRLKYTDFKSRSNGLFEDKTYNLGADGSIIVITGEAKAGKSALLAAVISSGFDEKEKCGFVLENSGDIVIIDTEQEEIWAYKYALRMCQMAGMDELPSNVHFYSWAGVDGAKERMKYLKKVVEMHPNMTTLMIDGIKDFVVDFVGDIKEVDSVMSYLKFVNSGREVKAITFVVAHVNPGTKKNPGSKVRGTLGTELQNKTSCILHVLKPEEGVITVQFQFVRGAQAPNALALLRDSATGHVYDGRGGHVPSYIKQNKFMPSLPPPVNRSVEAEEDLPF